jgi:hypothetical protein
MRALASQNQLRNKFSYKSWNMPKIFAPEGALLVEGTISPAHCKKSMTSTSSLISETDQTL